MKNTPKADPRELQPYLDAGWQLIPLHKWNYTDDHNGKTRERGKSPVDGNWTKRPYDNALVVNHMSAKGMNVGVRLRSIDLVIDIDPRHGGDESFTQLCKDIKLDADKYPTVITGSGGRHIYMIKTKGVSVVDSLKDYPGVEYKSLKRQVVSAGSIHPGTQATYEWDWMGVPLSEISQAPDALMKLITRPLVSHTAVGGGQYDQEEIAAMLDVLDPEDYSEQSAWFQLMQSCHHASNGDARAEFIEWSTRGEGYSDHGQEIGTRWDSLHVGGDGPAVTYRTLKDLVIKAGKEAVIPRGNPADDFEDDIDPTEYTTDMTEDGQTTGEKLSPLDRLNAKYIAVTDGGKFRIMYSQVDPSFTKPRTHWQSLGVYDFKNTLASQPKLQKGKMKVPLADAWIEWPGRRSAEGIIFDPEREHPGFLNLWQGWGVVPSKKGSWSCMDELLLWTLCDSNEEVYEYVLNWCAYMVQHPSNPAEVALVFKGSKGSGKGTFGRFLATIAGRHGLHISSSEHITGRFNSHLRDTILLFSDEAVKPYDQEAESRLKALITEPTLVYEAKGKDLNSGPSRLHVVMASNAEWVVPASTDERRFMISEVSDNRLNDSKFFGQLNAQLKAGGYEAFLWDMMHREIGDWTPRHDVPKTQAMVEEKMRGLGPVGKWWLEDVLIPGELPFILARPDEDDWMTGRVRMFHQDIREAYALYCERIGMKANSGGKSNEILFGKELKKVVPRRDFKTGNQLTPTEEEHQMLRLNAAGRARIFEVASLTDCRTRMNELLGGIIRWSE